MLKNQWFESNLSKITRLVTAIKYPRFTLFCPFLYITNNNHYHPSPYLWFAGPHGIWGWIFHNPILGIYLFIHKSVRVIRFFDFYIFPCSYQWNDRKKKGSARWFAWRHVFENIKTTQGLSKMLNRFWGENIAEYADLFEYSALVNPCHTAFILRKI